MDASLHQRKIIENYSFGLSSKIGKGFSSTVYKGKNDQTGEQVAIKVIEMKLLEEDDIYKALLRTELEALRSLAGHQYILHLFDTFSTKNNTYLMSQLCDTDLSKVIREKKTFQLHEALAAIQQILSGYMAIHKAGFVHRDLKPANIFLVNGHCKIADFGFAVPIADMANHTNYNVGSPLYMAPEALKENKYSFSSDIWAIAVILFEMLKGFPPWRARSEQTLYSKLVNEPIDNQLFDIPPECKEFVGRALKIDINQRFTPDEVSNWLMTFRRMTSSMRPLTAPATQRQNQLLPSHSLRMEIAPGTNIPNLNFQVNQAPLKEINVNGVVLTSKIPRENSIPLQFHTKTRDTSRSPMKEIKNRLTAITPKTTKENVMTFDQMQTRPQIMPNITYVPPSPMASLSNPIPQNNTVISTIGPSLSEPVGATSNTQALVVSYLNFCKFIYKLLQIVSSPLKFQFPSASLIQAILTSFLNIKVKKIWDLFEKGVNTSLSLDGWSEFSQSSSFRNMKAKVHKVYRKYTIMFPNSNEQFIFNSESAIQKGVHELLDYLNNNFDEKSVILMDYLTTAFQLLDLDKKYDANKFPTVSRIDVIVQGSPFNVSQEHLGKLINKIAIIGI